MARPTADDPVRQSLLDRLIDERFNETSLGRHGQSGRALKESVRRDLEDLFNSKRQWTTWPASWTELEDSLVNYGLPDFTGSVYAGPRAQADLKRVIEETIARFEPRLRQIQIEFLRRDRDISRQLRFRVKAVLQMDPYSEQISFESDVESGTGAVRIRDAAP
jgi:type VI secretion system protein ImpF